MRLLNWIVPDPERITIRYEIIGKVDGRWLIRSFDSSDRQLGTDILVSSTAEAFEIWKMLNGEAFDADTLIIDQTKAAA